jgi:hypothetical protein
LGARIFIPLDAELIYSASCGIDIHASPSPFQGDFDRVTIDQLIFLFTSLLLSFRQMELKTVGISSQQSLFIFRFVSLTLHDLFLLILRIDMCVSAGFRVDREPVGLTGSKDWAQVQRFVPLLAGYISLGKDFAV